MTIDLPSLVATIEKRSGAHVLVLGDLILDRYVWGEVNRISPEAPVPILEFKRETHTLGGAANVGANLASLGSTVELVGVVGTDPEGETFLSLCRAAGIRTDGIVVDGARPTTTKTRVIGHNQQIVRIDREKRSAIEAALVERARQVLRHVWDRIHAVVVSDYAKGVVAEPLLDELRSLARSRPVPVIVDPKNPQFSIYRDFTVMTPNLSEAAMGAGFKIDDDLALVEAGYKLRTSLNLEAVLITRGPQGMSLFEKGREVLHLPTVARNVYDVTGAGDTVTSVMALGLAAGLDLGQSAHLANHAAGIVIGKFGTSTVTLDDLRAVAGQPQS